MTLVDLKRPSLLLPKMKIGLTPEQQKDIMERAQKMFEGAKMIRSEYEGDWRDLAKYFMPHLYRDDTDTSKTKRSKWSAIINNTCRMAVRTTQAGMQSGLTNKARPWFRMGLEDFELAEYTPVREWMELATKRTLAIFARSNFYRTASTMYGVGSTFGTAARLHLYDYQDVMRFDMLMTGRYWIGINSRKVVDRLFFRSQMTVSQMVEEFGMNCPKKVIDMYDKGDYFQTEMVTVGVFPNPYMGWNRDGSTLIASNQKKFVSVHWMDGHDRPLKTAGYDRFPAQVPRWETTDDEAYGIGFGHDALGDTKSTQLKEMEKAKGIKKMVSPPVSAPSSMRNGQFPISGIAGSATYRPPNTNADAIQQLYQVNLPLNYLYEDIKIDEDRVNRAFYADLFLMLAMSERNNMTATEVAERHEEKLLALGPVIENLDNEFLDPSIERAFEIIMQNNLLPPPPPELEGQAMKVEYISLLAQAQQQVGIGAIERFLSFTGNLNALFPEKGVSDKIDADQIVDEVGAMLGVPQKIIISDDKVAETRAAKAEKQAQMEAVQVGMAGVQAAKTMAETPVSKDTLLSQVAGV